MLFKSKTLARTRCWIIWNGSVGVERVMRGSEMLEARVRGLGSDSRVMIFDFRL